MASVLDIFDPIISADQVEDGIVSFSQEWFPVYLREMELQTGRECGSLPLPRSYQIWDRFAKFEEDQLPAFVVISPGLDSKPQARGDGSYLGCWKVQAGIIVSASDQTATRQLSRIYAAAIRAMFVQKRSLGGIAVGTEWRDEAYDVVDNVADSRTITSAMVSFGVYVDNVVNRQGGPRTSPTEVAPDPRCPPDGQPGSQWPTVATVEVDEIIEGVGQ